MRRHCLFLAFAMTIAATFPAVGSDSVIEWRDDNQQVEPLNLKTEGRWIWLNGPVAQLKKPAYRVQVDFPKDAHVKILRLEGLRGLVVKVPGRVKTAALVVESKQREGRAQIEIVDPTGTTTRWLNVRHLSPAPHVMNDTSCAKHGLKLEADPHAGNFLSMGAICSKTRHSTRVVIVWSEDFSVETSKAVLVNGRTEQLDSPTPS